MKKILFSLVALVASMSMNAQVVKLMKGEKVVATYRASQVDNVVFEEEPAVSDYVEIAADYDNDPSTPATTLKWAKMNVGATSENDWGDFFAWGETEPRYISYTRSGDNITSFDWKTEYASGYASPYADYSGTTLDAAHDAATANWGGTWRTPTQAECQAMKNATTWKWDSTDKGYYVYIDEASSSDKSNALLFFPAAGYIKDTSFKRGGTDGYYWMSSLYTSNPASACMLYFYSTNVYLTTNTYRYGGLTVRPVSE